MIKFNSLFFEALKILIYLLFEKLIFMENEVIKCIKERRSIRNYLDKPLPKEIIEEIILAGRYAPSAENRQPWRFIVITNKQLINELSLRVKKQIAKILEKRGKWKKKFKELEDERLVLFLKAISNSKEDVVFYDAPALIFIIAKDEIFNLESCACCAENMMLAAWSLGIGSCWIGLANFLELDEEAMEKIGMPTGYKIMACIIFGYPMKIPKATIRNPSSDVIKWIE